MGDVEGGCEGCDDGVGGEVRGERDDGDDAGGTVDAVEEARGGDERGALFELLLFGVVLAV